MKIELKYAYWTATYDKHSTIKEISQVEFEKLKKEVSYYLYENIVIDVQGSVINVYGTKLERVWCKTKETNIYIEKKINETFINKPINIKRLC